MLVKPFAGRTLELLMLPNAAVARTLADHLVLLGGIPADRVHADPVPGTATLDDWIAAANRGVNCELVDGTLVDRPMGFYESLLAVCIAKYISLASDNGRLGVTSGEQGFIRLGETQVRAPDVAFFLRAGLPEGRLPTQRVPAICPDIAVEILSSPNTPAEMTQKRKEYFQAGCRLVWMVDPVARSVAVYRSPSQMEVVGIDSYLVGGSVLPNFKLRVADLFSEVDGDEAPSFHFLFRRCLATHALPQKNAIEVGPGERPRNGNTRRDLLRSSCSLAAIIVLESVDSVRPTRWGASEKRAGAVIALLLIVLPFIVLPTIPNTGRARMARG